MTKPANVEQFEGGASEWLLEKFLMNFAEEQDDNPSVTDVLTAYGVVTLTYRPWSEF